MNEQWLAAKWHWNCDSNTQSLVTQSHLSEEERQINCFSERAKVPCMEVVIGRSLNIQLLGFCLLGISSTAAASLVPSRIKKMKTVTGGPSVKFEPERCFLFVARSCLSSVSPLLWFLSWLFLCTSPVPACEILFKDFLYFSKLFRL